jgi:hypothetical protein
MSPSRYPWAYTFQCGRGFLDVSVTVGFSRELRHYEGVGRKHVSPERVGLGAIGSGGHVIAHWTVIMIAADAQ